MKQILVPLTAAETHAQMMAAVTVKYGLNVAIALDRLGNTLADGNSDETISSRCARDTELDQTTGGHHYPLADVLSWFLTKLQKDHGAYAIATDEADALKIATIEEQSGLIQSTFPSTPK